MEGGVMVEVVVVVVVGFGVVIVGVGRGGRGGGSIGIGETWGFLVGDVVKSGVMEVEAFYIANYDVIFFFFFLGLS